MDAMDYIAEQAASADYEDRDALIMKPFSHVRQGDVYLVLLPSLDSREKLAGRIKELVPDFFITELGNRSDNLQLAPGETRGSRHMVSAKDAKVVDIYSPKRGAHACEGPVVVANGRWTLEHPEHANVSMPDGTFQVLYQRDVSFEEARRVAD